MFDYLPVFATPFFKGHLEVPQGALIYWEEMAATEGRSKSNRGGWQSKECIGGPFAMELQTYLQKAFPNFDVASMWVNVNRPGDENVPHIHPGSDLAFAWYLTDSEGLKVQNPNIFQQFNLLREFSHREGNVYESIDFNFAAGDIVVFPSHCVHSVNPNSGTTNRVSMSGNLKWNPRTAETNATGNQGQLSQALSE